MNFFESFHEAHPKLTEITQILTKQELFQDNYLSEALAVGLPKEFTSPTKVDLNSMLNMSRRRSGSELTIGQFHLHLELQMMSHLKSFFSER